MDNKRFRALTQEEISILERQGNYAENWQKITIDIECDLSTIHNNYFMGDVALGSLIKNARTLGGMTLPEGIYNCMIANTQIGNHCALHQVKMLSGYAIGDYCTLFNIGEMTATGEHAWLEPMNENGGRRIIPFAGMTSADAYLWAKYRDHNKMVKSLELITRRHLKSIDGRYGQVGPHCRILNTTAIRNVDILSDIESPSHIQDCITLSDGVIGYGCRLEYGCIATRFALGENVKLEYGVRLNDTVVGDNSTIARCEVGNSLIFPSHEQHHNNSFLIASLVMGQSNLAAGCTIGSNHNGRTADNELVAGRGFWPGLCTSLKHSSAFASYTLLAKGDYPAELSITLPFSLVNNNVAKNQLEVMPAYWWMYNMYALNRNITKYAKRDKRIKKSQSIIYTPFAPDTAEEIINARMLLKYWIEQAYFKTQDSSMNRLEQADTKMEVLGYGLEKGKRKAVIVKWAEGYKAYEEMLIYYAMGVLTHGNTTTTLPDNKLGCGEREREWVNMGGQLVPQHKIDQLITHIENGEIDSWEQIHEQYDLWWKEYDAMLRQHAYQVLCYLGQCATINEPLWQKYLQQYTTIQQYVADQVRITRQKDDNNPFRQMTYRNDAEKKSVLE